MIILNTLIQSLVIDPLLEIIGALEFWDGMQKMQLKNKNTPSFNY